MPTEKGKVEGGKNNKIKRSDKYVMKEWKQERSVSLDRGKEREGSVRQWRRSERQRARK